MTPTDYAAELEGQFAEALFAIKEAEADLTRALAEISQRPITAQAYVTAARDLLRFALTGQDMEYYGRQYPKIVESR